MPRAAKNVCRLLDAVRVTRRRAIERFGGCSSGRRLPAKNGGTKSGSNAGVQNRPAAGLFLHIPCGHAFPQGRSCVGMAREQSAFFKQRRIILSANRELCGAALSSAFTKNAAHRLPPAVFGVPWALLCPGRALFRARFGRKAVIEVFRGLLAKMPPPLWFFAAKKKQSAGRFARFLAAECRKEPNLNGACRIYIGGAVKKQGVFIAYGFAFSSRRIKLSGGFARLPAFTGRVDLCVEL